MKHRYRDTLPRLFAALALPALLPAAGFATNGSAATTSERPRTCLVLSGGGARGIAHVGVLQALQELRIPVDCIVGTSMGAIVGGAYAAGRTPDELAEIVRATQWDRVLSDEGTRASRSVRNKSLERRRLIGAEIGVGKGGAVFPLGALVGTQLDLFLQSVVGAPIAYESFNELAIPFRAIATNIENGRMVVLDKGNLAPALRASMAVPGAFVPSEVDGALLADGGLVRNLGVDVARELGAQRVIAVNLGTPLLDRDALSSVLGVTEQMIYILTEQNVERSLAELRPDDVLIRPELKGFSAADFSGSVKSIEIGSEAVHAAAEQLESFRVSEQAYSDWFARRFKGGPDVRYAAVELDTSGLSYSNPSSAQAVFLGGAASVHGDGELEQGIDRLLATDDFQQVSLRTETRDAGSVLVVEPREKRWGPNYLRLGLNFSTDVTGDSSFTLLADHRATWLNASGLELRSDLALGARSAIGVELFQPLNAMRNVFLSGRLSWNSTVESLYLSDQEPAVARFRITENAARIELGRYVGNYGELRAGYSYSGTSSSRDLGVPGIDLPSERIGRVTVRGLIDRLDAWDFPRSGWFAAAEYSYADDALGGDSDYHVGEIDLQRAFGRDRHSLTVGLRVGDAFGTSPPLSQTFSLGGFQTLSGFADGQLLGRELVFGRAVYGYQLGVAGSVLRLLYAGGSLEAGRVGGRINGPPRDDVVIASSLYLAADTGLGPAYLGVGVAEGGHYALYLFLGRP